MNTLSESYHTTTPQDTQETPVVFRVMEGEVIALFPAQHEPGGMVGSYMRVGQHGPASYEGVVENSRPASEYEYQDLHDELEGLGYKLRVLRKKPISM